MHDPCLSLLHPIKAYVRRFPSCHLVPVFVDSEVLSERHSEDGATVVTERRCKVEVDAPRLLKRVLTSPLTSPFDFSQLSAKANSSCHTQWLPFPSPLQQICDLFIELVVFFTGMATLSVLLSDYRNYIGGGWWR